MYELVPVINGDRSKAIKPALMETKLVSRDGADRLPSFAMWSTCDFRSNVSQRLYDPFISPQGKSARTSADCQLLLEYMTARLARCRISDDTVAMPRSRY